MLACFFLQKIKVSHTLFKKNGEKWLYILSPVFLLKTTSQEIATVA